MRRCRDVCSSSRIQRSSPLRPAKQLLLLLQHRLTLEPDAWVAGDIDVELPEFGLATRLLDLLEVDRAVAAWSFDVADHHHPAVLGPDRLDLTTASTGMTGSLSVELHLIGLANQLPTVGIGLDEVDGVVEVLGLKEEVREQCPEDDADETDSSSDDDKVRACHRCPGYFVHH